MGQKERLENIDRPSKLYAFLRPFVAIFHSLAYRKIIVKGKENIPKDTATIFAPNHQNALMDALGIVFTSGIQSVFLSRADIFNNPLILRLLTFFKQMPVYRIRDGYRNLNKNDDTFERTSKVLLHKRYLCLYPEAAHTGKRSFLLHKKAIPKIAFLAGEKSEFKLDVKIVPVGVYYDHFIHFRGILIIEYGRAIDVSDYYDLYQKSPNKAIYQLQQRIFNDLSKTTVNIRNKDNYEEIETVRQVLGNEERKDWGKNRWDVTASDVSIVEQLEALESKNSEAYESILSLGKKYKAQMESIGVTDELLIQKGIGFSKAAWNIFILLIVFPIFVFGVVLNIIPFGAPRIVFMRVVKDAQLRRTFMFVFGLLFYPIWSIVIFLVAHAVFSSWILGIVNALLVIPTGVVSYEYLRIFKNLFQRLRIAGFKGENKSKMKSCLNQRDAIIAEGRKNLL